MRLIKTKLKLLLLRFKTILKREDFYQSQKNITYKSLVKDCTVLEKKTFARCSSIPNSQNYRSVVPTAHSPRLCGVFFIHSAYSLNPLFRVIFL